MKIAIAILIGLALCGSAVAQSAAPTLKDSSLIRFLLEVACSGIDSGKIPDSLDSLQEYLREPCRPQIVRGK